MAQAVAGAIHRRGRLVAEAGTGTGKTFAYLVPALLHGGKVIVSTGTKTLQDQLYERDVPLLRDALAVPATIALLKGRANYVCLHHLERASRDDRLPSRDDARHLRRIVAFAHATDRGDRAQLADVPENASIWPLVTSTRDNCLGSQCAHFRDCFVMKARKEAMDADVVIVNHHLFFADVMLRDEGLAELLPSCNTVILDEAHQLPDTATLFFGEQVAAGQLADLARDAEVAARSALRDVPDLPDAAAGLQPAIRRLRL
ncbi:MAG: ATP-dependent DNA helicase, partial [Burkholderiales bacterium]|nr:ATP-dependent DNA helicase [Burkholderiales bacterium]